MKSMKIIVIWIDLFIARYKIGYDEKCFVLLFYFLDANRINIGLLWTTLILKYY